MSFAALRRHRLLILLGAVSLLAGCGHTEAGSTTPATTSPSQPTAPIVVSISPLTATVQTAGGQVFTATVTGGSGGATGILWSVNGIAGGNSTLGTIVSSGSSGASSTGVYTAPAVPPSPAIVALTATSTADDSKSASASVTVTCGASNTMAPAAISVGLGQTQVFTASLCVASGTPITWDVNGVVNGNAATGTLVIAGATTALYTAPFSIPSVNPVTIHASANPSSGVTASASATVTLTSSVSISVSPSTATLAPSQRMSFTASVLNSSDTTVFWAVNGITNGNDIVGQICAAGTIPCAPPASPASGDVDYLAPSTPPSTNPVTLTAISHADLSRSAAALITVTPSQSGSVTIAISPQYAFLAPSTDTPSTQQFFATVTGASNTGISWSVQSGVPGTGCAGAACGSVSAAGLYSAPSTAPSPNRVAIIATSAADPTKSASAAIGITSGPTIEAILPSSATADPVESFPLEVQGTGFAAGAGGSSSVILVNGTSRGTTCSSTTACATTMNPSDFQSAGTITIQVQNPGSPGALSNPVPFVIEPFEASEAAISLTAGQPIAAAANITVVEPTTAASSSPLDVDFVGYLTGGNTCGVQGSPLAIVRPSSGTAVASVCIHGAGLDPTFTYSFTGPGAPSGSSDIGVTASAINGLFPNTIGLDLQISSSTLPGVRTLLISNLNNDRAVATGMLELK